MTKIQILNKDVAEKIAAGEVVERPISIIKELVENSIDAESTSIVVEIKKSGKNYIRVTDNGIGIDKSDIALTYIRHATSKIFTAKDLESIETLGFRGEALASISAVSFMQVISKTKDEKLGNRITIKGGELVENISIGCSDGTTIIVKDLFYNTPVRAKFMKPDNIETSLIIEFLSQIALAYPKIKFQLINNDNIVFSTSGRGDRLETIIALSNPTYGENLLFVKNEKDLNYENDVKIKLEGYISKVGESRNSRKGQIFFVNGRVINSKLFEKALDEAYKEKIPKGRFPSAYIFLNISPELLDVNIHPNKREIRFYNDDVIFLFLLNSIREALRVKFAIPNAENDNKVNNKTNSDDEKELFDITEIIDSPNNDVHKNVDKKIFVEPLGVQLSMKPALNDFETQNKKIEGEIKKFIIESSEMQKNIDLSSSIKENESTYLNDIEIENHHNDNNILIEDDINNSIDEVYEDISFENMTIHGIVFGTYIILSEGDNMYLLDQHAAHERINYEMMINELNKQNYNVQAIFIPIIITVSTSQYNNSSSWISSLSKFGFEVEDFGPNTIRINGIPTFLTIEEAEIFASDFIDSIDENFEFDNEVLLAKIAQKACKASIKANDRLKSQEIKQLLFDLQKCNNPLSCPHGRPTFVKYEKKDIEKKFTRI